MPPLKVTRERESVTKEYECDGVSGEERWRESMRPAGCWKQNHS